MRTERSKYERTDTLTMSGPVQQGGIQMMDTNQLPSYRLNNFEKTNFTSEFTPLFQGKVRTKEMPQTGQMEKALDLVNYQSEGQ